MAEGGRSSNVVSLHGGGHVKSAEPNATLIEELERLIEAARAGEIVGMAGSYVHRDCSGVSYSYAGLVGGYALVGGLACLQQRLVTNAIAGER